jgi:hypothetical protein
MSASVDRRKQILALTAISALAITTVVFDLVIAETPATQNSDKLDYTFHIRPILADRCFVCHGPDKGTRKAELRLDKRDAAIDQAGVIVPGKPDESELIRRITTRDLDERMPARESKLHLTADEIALLTRWVNEGAEYKEHWAFLPLPKTIEPPSVNNDAWPANPIDRFVLARYEREALTPSPAASKEDWLRRVSFDLTGLPPTIAEIDAFLADTSAQAYEKVVDRLLASPHFGERMATDWLDAARYADSFGYQADGDTHVWPWRDWVVEAFNENLPYDRFLTWQIAGDLLPDATRNQRLATAFSRLNRMTNEGGSIAEEFRQEYVSDRVHTLGTAVLGLTLECTRCHDHKYDPLTQRDYYSLGAFFNSIDEWGTYDNSQFRPTPTLLLTTPKQEKAIAEHRRRLRDLEERMRELRESREGDFRAWLEQSPMPETPALIGHYSLDSLETDGRLVANKGDAGKTSPANRLVPGKLGQALEFTGDDAATIPPKLQSLERTQPYTIAFWLRTADETKQGIVLHRQAGTDTGFHGTELSFDDGRLFFALIRFWPGNAIAIRTRDKIPAGEWTHIAITYDGSSTAAGMAIYINGARATTDILRDRLYKNLEAGGDEIAFGERFRSVGLKRGAIDELRLYDRPLTAIEISQIHDGKSLGEAIAAKDADRLRDYYFAAIDPDLAKLRDELKAARQQLFQAEHEVSEIMTMEEMPDQRPAFILHRGEYDAPRERVDRNTPAVLPSFPADAPRNRFGLARWLTHPDHPLTARVAVNRYWQLFFGCGLVPTTENFGTQGALPSHPELLDWLARDFVATGWDVKHLCKQIVLSSTYRQRSAAPRELRDRDPDNVLLARGPSRRLSAEMLRDSALATSGLLVRTLGGPPVKPYQPPGLWKGQNAFLPEYVPDKGESLYRRTLYTFWRRTSPPPNMLALDAAPREVCTVRRQTTSTPVQPLVLLNDPQWVEAARALATRMLRQGGATPRDQLAFAFRTVCTRRPSDQELDLLVRLFDDQLARFRSDADGAKNFLAIGEHKADGDSDPAPLAAATALASAILNLDAAIVLR